MGVEISQDGAEGAGLGIGPVRLDAVDQHVPLAVAPSCRDLDRGNDANAAARRPSCHLRHRALSVMVGDGYHSEAATRQVIDQGGRRPGAVRGMGVQVEIDGVRWSQRQWLQRRGASRDLVRREYLAGLPGRILQNTPVRVTALAAGQSSRPIASSASATVLRAANP